MVVTCWGGLCGMGDIPPPPMVWGWMGAGWVMALGLGVPGWSGGGLGGRGGVLAPPGLPTIPSVTLQDPQSTSQTPKYSPDPPKYTLRTP